MCRIGKASGSSGTAPSGRAPQATVQVTVQPHRVGATVVHGLRLINPVGPISRRRWHRYKAKAPEYIEANSAKCRIAPQMADQLKAIHKNTEAMRVKVCAVAQGAQRRQPAGPVGDFDDIR